MKSRRTLLIALAVSNSRAVALLCAVTPLRPSLIYKQISIIHWYAVMC